MKDTIARADSRIDQAHAILCRFGMASYSAITATTAFLIPVSVAVTFIAFINLTTDPSQTFDHPITGSMPTIDETMQRIGFSVVFAPILETLLCQFLAIEVLKKFISSAAVLIAVTALIFGLGHLGRSLQSAAIASFVGLFLSFTYLHWLRKTASRLKACIAVILTHATYNFYYVVLTYIPASILF